MRVRLVETVVAVVGGYDVGYALVEPVIRCTLIASAPDAERRVVAEPDDLVLRVGKSKATVERALAALIAAGKVEHRGSKKTGGYYLVGEAR